MLLSLCESELGQASIGNACQRSVVAVVVGFSVDQLFLLVQLSTIGTRGLPYSALEAAGQVHQEWQRKPARRGFGNSHGT